MVTNSLVYTDDTRYIEICDTGCIILSNPSHHHQMPQLSTKSDGLVTTSTLSHIFIVGLNRYILIHIRHGVLSKVNDNFKIDYLYNCFFFF